MRKLLLSVAISAAIFVGMAGVTAHAQPPQEIAVTDTLELRPGDARVFKFDQPVTKIVVTSEGVVHIMPQSDHTFIFQAQGPGKVLAIAYGDDGHVVHGMNIVVSAQGHMVKVYGYRKVPDYVGFVCTSTGCGRADPDVEPTPSEVTVSKTHQDKNGDSTTIQKEYR